MWNRACPLCFAKTPRSLILTRVEDLTCPSCHTPLELSRLSKLLAAAVGLLTAYIVVRFLQRAHANATYAWVLPLVEAVLAYAIGSVIALLFFSDLVVRPQSSSAVFPHSHS